MSVRAELLRSKLLRMLWESILTGDKPEARRFENATHTPSQCVPQPLGRAELVGREPHTSRGGVSKAIWHLGHRAASDRLPLFPNTQAWEIVPRAISTARLAPHEVELDLKLCASGSGIKCWRWAQMAR